MHKNELLTRYHQHPEMFRTEGLSVDVMYKIIANKFLRLEEMHYRNGWVFPPEAKLLFLVGTDEIDVTRAETSTGIPIYTKKADHIKAPEIVEAISAISDHFERERNAPNVLLELADVWYNLIQLTKLDEDFAPTYQKCIDELCKTMGYSLESACQLVMLKYKVRLLDNLGKNRHVDEVEAMNSWLEKDEGWKFPESYDDRFNDAYRLLNKMSLTILKPRLLQLQTLQSWRRAEWQLLSGASDGSLPGLDMYLNRTTIGLLDKFKASFTPKADVVVQPIMNGLDGADMSFSLAFPNIRYITGSQRLASHLVDLGFMTYRQDPLRIKFTQEIDILLLNTNREVLLSSVRDGGYVIQSVGNEYIHRRDYKPVGVLTHERYTGNPILDADKPWQYRTEVRTDREFIEVSDILTRDEGQWETNEQTAIPVSFSGRYCIRYPQAAVIVRELTGETSNIVGHYRRILDQFESEGSAGPIHELFKNNGLFGLAYLPYKQYGAGETYFVFQRVKNGGNR